MSARLCRESANVALEKKLFLTFSFFHGTTQKYPPPTPSENKNKNDTKAKAN